MVVSSTTEARSMVTTKEVREAVWYNGSVSDVGIGYRVNAVFNERQRTF